METLLGEGNGTPLQYFAWKILWMEEPHRPQSMGSLGVRHDWETSLSLFTFMHSRRKWQPTPVFLPGESQGRGSLVGCHLWGRRESETTEATQQQQQQHSWKRRLFLPGDFGHPNIQNTNEINISALLKLEAQKMRHSGLRAYFCALWAFAQNVGLLKLKYYLLHYCIYKKHWSVKM